ncbi:MAG: hypothetical protein QW092_03130, partial [Candidatus Korarchaeum sp.]
DFTDLITYRYTLDLSGRCLPSLTELLGRLYQGAAGIPIVPAFILDKFLLVSGFLSLFNIKTIDAKFLRNT